MIYRTVCGFSQVTAFAGIAEALASRALVTDNSKTRIKEEGLQMKTRIHLTVTLIVFWLAAVDIGFAQQSDQVGKVQFANSCSPVVQEKLLLGIAMLHSFY
jgi:hypothetical protein